MDIKNYLLKKSQKLFAEQIGVSQTMVSRWSRGVKVSAESVFLLAKATDWQVTPHELRPDLYPHPEDGLPASLRQSLPVVDAGCSDVHGHLLSPPTSPHNA